MRQFISVERRDMLIRYLLRNMKRQSIELDRQQELIKALYERLGKVESELKGNQSFHAYPKTSGLIT